ncbi:hypothetical protein E4U32_001316 [Claviceps aff. humidiphila group G2b]|nr:hypothetical protein E4U32_001316 [Claviceps aff. humidiphila group G2b]
MSIARRPSRSEMDNYLQGLKDLQQQSVTASLEEGSKEDAKEDAKEDTKPYTVRYFEEDEHGRRELPSDGDGPGGGPGGGLDGSRLKDILTNMQSNLGSEEEKSAFQSVLREVAGDMSDVKSSTDVEVMMKRLASYTKSIDDQIASVNTIVPREIIDKMNKSLEDLTMPDDFLNPRRGAPQIPEKGWTSNHRKKINMLNHALRRADAELQRKRVLTDKTVAAVYKAYCHAAHNMLSYSWSSVPSDVWDFLWTVFSASESIDVHRLGRIARLARDMDTAKVAMSPPQQLLSIEAMFLHEMEAKAVAIWKRCVHTLGDENADSFRKYWELGVRIFCRLGDMRQAEKATRRLLGRMNAHPRILMPMIRTYAEQATPEGQQQAWDTYRKMRDLLGKDMTLSDYDQVISFFLVASHTEGALFAFVDMMSNGAIDMKKQKQWPSAVTNKFFLGKWLKRLIGAGELDGAFQVVQFMKQKGVNASPIQLNGLIGAWQRSGGVGDLECADKLAWDMIESRIRFVKARESSEGGAATALWAPSAWPPATRETFCLLADNYRQRNSHANMENLWEALRDARVSPDAFMMNQLLESHFQVGQYGDALRLYHALVTDGGMAPDPYTFSALWKTPGINRGSFPESSSSLPDHYSDQVSHARSLFREIMQHMAVFEPEGMNGQLSRKILHTFRRLDDNAGFLVAITTLKEYFRFTPTEPLALELVMGAGKLMWDTREQRAELLKAKTKLDDQLLAYVDGDKEKLQEGGQARQDALYRHLQKMFWPWEHNEEKRRELEEAMKQMGVYELLARRAGK